MAYKDLFVKELKVSLAQLPISQETRDGLHKSLFGPLAFYTFLPVDVLDNCVENKDRYVKDVVCLGINASYYVATMIAMDKIVDSDGNDLAKSKRSMIDYLFYVKEYAVRGLQKLIGDASFWETFDGLKAELFRNSSYTNDSFNGNDDNLLNTLLSKSALAKAYTLSLRTIIDEPFEWERMDAALEAFHTAFQLYDDYEDLRTDLNTNQLNYYLYNGKQVENIESEELIKRLFLNGTIEKGLMMALSKIEYAAQIFSDLGLANCHKVSKYLSVATSNSIFEIKRLIEKATTKAELSNRVMHINCQRASISKSLDFIFKKQKDDEMWSDFMTSAGTGDSWVTGFVINMLGEFPANQELLQKPLTRLSSVGGKYNKHLIFDADSLNFLLRAKKILGYEIPKADIARWHTFKHTSGGFSTYRGKDITKVIHVAPESDVTGWTSEHCCVTSVACWVAKALNFDKDFHDGINYLKSNIMPDGNVPSYWWTEDIYSNAFAVMCGFRDEVLDYLLRQQSEEGYWCNMGKPSFFYSALAIRALEDISMAEKHDALFGKIEKGLQWIVRNQYEDGSWDSEFILRIPSPHICTPTQVSNWKRSSFGFNVITDDYARIFTTSLVYNVLKHFYDELS
jgi:hypothetical protein